MDENEKCNIINSILKNEYINETITIDQIIFNAKMNRSTIDLKKDPCRCYEHVPFEIYLIIKGSCKHDRFNMTYKYKYMNELTKLQLFINKFYNFNKILKELILHPIFINNICIDWN